eukprot:CAMPEP_0117852116 /NCGR_PEP_ID=MMETSP0949-20121206/22870_1 /TAXON_ID=44440 /ORGANISM="Chattonella subsalsa, Strain CCMP2191" /LENGTH=274 /DNA_ID=CAMNT_0005700197 /DNA_START=99 /DNA_END=923 /DNA_ORIENTATION=+
MAELAQLSFVFGTTNVPKSSILGSFSNIDKGGAECEAVSGFHGQRAMIGPSVLASDLSNLAGESQRVLEDGADYVHLDVMDGHFVPNLTFGAPVIKCLRKHLPNAILDVHLMVTHPEQWIDDMANAGASIFTFHIEAEGNPAELIQKIKAKGMKVGISLKPGTPVEDVLPYVADLDLVLIMTVEPGFGGQSFMEDMMAKVVELRQKFPSLDIEVDGGLGPSTIDAAAKAGANWIVAGSAVFKSNPAHVISVLKRSVEKHGNGIDEAELTSLVPL